jgi:tetratricopeptide (TPR) repeat protein
LEKIPDQQTRAESKTRLVEQSNICLRSGDYSRALDLLRGAAAEFPNDAELSEIEKRAQDGVQRNAEAQRLITESQALFAQRKSAEAIQLLREAYELDENNALARAILANALVEHAHSKVETDWREAEMLAKQALDLNPAHPTAKTIRSLILDRKKASPVEEWVAQARKLQSSGDLFAALSRVEEGLDIYPNDPKLLQTQDAIQRDQNLRRRQARRRDLENLRRMELEIDGAADDAAKKTLADRIQAVAANYWTDGEIIAVANGLMQRLGLVSQTSSTASPHGAVIFHVPPRSALKSSPADSSRVPLSPVAPENLPPANVPASIAPANVAPPSKVSLGVELRGKVPTNPAEPQVAIAPATTATVPAVEPSAPQAKVTASSSQRKQATRSNSKTLILVSAPAIVVVAAAFFFARKHQAPPVAKAPATGPNVSAPAVPAPAAPAPVVSAPAVTSPAQTTPEPSAPASGVSSDTAAGNATVDDRTPNDQTPNDQPPNDQPPNDQPPNDQPPAEPGHSQGTLVVVAGQDDAKVFLNGNLQPQLTQAGQLRLPNLEPKDYVVKISKRGFQDPPQQTVRIRKGEQARLVFSLQPQNLQPRNLQPQNLQAQPRLASLTIQGGVPGTKVLVDQTLVGTIQTDGTLSPSAVNPGDRTVELRKDRFKPRQFKKHFEAGETIALAAADAVLEATPEAALGELKITFAPADAKVAIVKGELLKIVSSGVPLTLAAGTYTLTARTAERFTRSSTLEVVAGQSKTLDLSLAPSGMSKWEDPGAWKHEGDSFICKGGNFVLYGVVPASGTFVFSAMLTKGHVLQWVLNYSDPRNYVLFQMDDNNFYRTVIRNGEKRDEIIVPDRGDKKSFRTVQIRVSPTELVHQIKQGEIWTQLDRWTQPGSNLSLGKFGFYIPGSDQVALSSFAHYVDLNLR